MRYTLIWRRTAEVALAHLWNTAGDRQAVTDAADTIDSALRDNPLLAGESRGGITRIVMASPLAVYCDVSEADRTVFVWAVWRSGGS